MNRATGTLIVAGMGQGGPALLTLQTIEALKTCAETLVLVHAEAFLPFARGAGIRAKRVAWVGASGRGLSTQALAKELNKRLGRGERVGVLVDGHPEIFSPASELCSLVSAAGHEVRRLAAIGSLDELLISAERAFGGAFSSGFSVVNALSVDWPTLLVEPTLALLVYNLGPVSRGEPKRFNSALSTLNSACAGRGMCLIECVPGGENIVITTPARLSKDLRRVGLNFTLCVEPRR